MSNFYEVKGLTQRKRMCAECPARPLAPDTEPYSDDGQHHRCHMRRTMICAQALTATEDGRCDLRAQLAEERSL